MNKKLLNNQLNKINKKLLNNQLNNNQYKEVEKYKTIRIKLKNTSTITHQSI